MRCWWSLFCWSLGNLLVNAFILHRTAHKHVWLSNKKALSHYEFRKHLPMALLDPKGKCHHFNSRALGETLNSCDHEEMSAESCARPSGKCLRITDASVNPDTGLFNIRLVKTLGHLWLSAENKNTKCCALYRHATGRHIRQQLLRCSISNVHSCSSCFSLFHSEKDPIKIKRKMQKDMIQYDKSKSK